MEQAASYPLAVEIGSMDGCTSTTVTVSLGLSALQTLGKPRILVLRNIFIKLFLSAFQMV